MLRERQSTGRQFSPFISVSADPVPTYKSYGKFTREMNWLLITVRHNGLWQEPSPADIWSPNMRSSFDSRLTSQPPPPQQGSSVNVSSSPFTNGYLALGSAGSHGDHFEGHVQASTLLTICSAVVGSCGGSLKIVKDGIDGLEPITKVRYVLYVSPSLFI